MFQRLQDIESRLGQSVAVDGRPLQSVATSMDELEQRLVELQSRARRAEETTGMHTA